ncbi:hypothetical protein D3C71_1436810 [compost metagenome]
MGQLRDRRPEAKALRLALRDQETFGVQRVQQAVKRRPAQVQALEQLGHQQPVVAGLEGQQDVERALDGAHPALGFVGFGFVGSGVGIHGATLPVVVHLTDKACAAGGVRNPAPDGPNGNPIHRSSSTGSRPAPAL